ncbi:HrpB1 family type III secretion system apparatus protein [Mycoavidus cysteinexigens]|nr:HrpB1 family type III secretion system apparatus protein [Mycoavidus cysteinexigens]
MMTYLDCDDEVIWGLIDVISAAVVGDSTFQEKEGDGPDPGDIELMINAVRVLRPNLLEFEIYEAMLLMKRGLLDDAVRTINRILSLRPDFNYGKAILAFCLLRKRDPKWTILADQVIEANEPPEAVKLVTLLQEYIAFVEGRLAPSEIHAVKILEESSKAQVEAFNTSAEYFPRA